MDEVSFECGGTEVYMRKGAASEPKRRLRTSNKSDLHRPASTTKRLGGPKHSAAQTTSSIWRIAMASISFLFPHVHGGDSRSTSDPAFRLKGDPSYWLVDNEPPITKETVPHSGTEIIARDRTV